MTELEEALKRLNHSIVSKHRKEKSILVYCNDVLALINRVQLLESDMQYLLLQINSLPDSAVYRGLAKSKWRLAEAPVFEMLSTEKQLAFLSGVWNEGNEQSVYSVGTQADPEQIKCNIKEIE